ncbi:MAG: Dabb family protein [Candidatus Hydrogenedentes bacterium]|nr:Dabb family protein [Candidatus Hydrogenedentota bacterium]
MKPIAFVAALVAIIGLTASSLAVTAVEKKESVKVLRHIVMFKFEESTSKTEVQNIVDAFVALEGKIDIINAFEWGTNVSKEGLDKGLTHGFTLTFKSQEDLDAYIVHPDHKAFVGLLGGKLADVCVFDYWAQ